MRMLAPGGYAPGTISTPVQVTWGECQGCGGVDAGQVLKRVPQNTPVTWCVRMHFVGKKTGEPRRVVDMRQLNTAKLQQTHYTETPFAQSSGVPLDTWRFISDAWNGYHSVPIDARDRHLTTFLTPWGQMRYLAVTQGCLSSGDGFTYSYNMVMPHMPWNKKFIDDVL